MKEIQTNRFKRKKADLIESPPIATEEDLPKRKKKKKKIYQLGIEIDDVEMGDT